MLYYHRAAPPGACWHARVEACCNQACCRSIFLFSSVNPSSHFPSHDTNTPEPRGGVRCWGHPTLPFAHPRFPLQGRWLLGIHRIACGQRRHWRSMLPLRSKADSPAYSTAPLVLAGTTPLGPITASPRYRLPLRLACPPICSRPLPSGLATRDRTAMWPQYPVHRQATPFCLPSGRLMGRLSSPPSPVHPETTHVASNLPSPCLACTHSSTLHTVVYRWHGHFGVAYVLPRNLARPDRIADALFPFLAASLK